MLAIVPNIPVDTLGVARRGIRRNQGDQFTLESRCVSGEGNCAHFVSTLTLQRVAKSSPLILNA
jgi:hypothetical protein